MPNKIKRVIACLSVLLILGWGFCAYAKSNSSDETGQSDTNNSSDHDNSGDSDDSHSGDNGHSDDSDSHEGDSDNHHDGDSSGSDHDNSGDNDDSHSGDSDDHHSDGNGNSDDSDSHDGSSDDHQDGNSNDEGEDDSSNCCPKPSPITFTFKDSSGLGASAKVSVGNDQIVIELMNTSLGVPSGFSNSDQLLTSIAFSLPAGTAISGGSAVIGSGSYSVNFSEVQVQLGAGGDVSTEWGYGNSGNTGFGSHLNFISSMTSHTTPFLNIPPGTNLDKSVNLGGPEGGLTNGVLPIGGIGAIYNSITSYLNISGIDLSNNCDTTSLLSYIKENGAIFEFGSDAYFGDSLIIPPPPPDTPGSTNPVPEPSTFLLIAAGFLGLIGFLKKKKR